MTTESCIYDTATAEHAVIHEDEHTATTLSGLL
jgi:hypothetical protein